MTNLVASWAASYHNVSMYKLTFYVPESHLEAVKNALFAKGAGRIGNYDCCAWQTLGTGQYRPLKGSKPFLGQVDEIEKIPEYLVEMVCEDALLDEVMQELLRVHPYDTPAYGSWKIL
jgi:structural hemagglutinin/hemolysin toxin protein RtxA